MMRQRIVWMVLGLLLPVLMMEECSVGYAAPVGKDAAKQKALEFFSGRGPAKARGARGTGSVLELRLALTNDSYHVFNRGDHDGFVMVSGDDCAGDILAYSDSGTFDAENMPENLKAWLQGYTEQIEWMKQNGVTTKDTDDSSASANIQAGSPHAVNRAPRAKIDSLLTSKWGQEFPYNGLTPLQYQFPDTLPLLRHCLTGCVATAMAQVMYYWYKEMGYETKLVKDIPKYTDWRYSLSGLKAPETFDWSHMTDRYDDNSSDTENIAVAKLMMYCGFSVKMKYGLDESGAKTTNLAKALPKYFGYQSAQYVNSWDYTYEDWQTLIYEDLKNRRPVIMGGSENDDDAHEFICDGYDYDDYFHFNWGWNGNHDGYYKMSTCHKFPLAKVAVCCIHPTNTIPLIIEPMESASTSSISVSDVNIPTLYSLEVAEVTMTVKNTSSKKTINNEIAILLYGDNDVSYTVGVSKIHLEPKSSINLTVPITLSAEVTPRKYLLTINSLKDEYYLRTHSFREVNVKKPLPKIDGGVRINESYAAPAYALSYRLNGDLASVPSGDLQQQWVISRNVKDRWEEIPGATRTTYTPSMLDVGKYVCVRVKAKGYQGWTESDKQLVVNPLLEGNVLLPAGLSVPGARVSYFIYNITANNNIHAQWQRSNSDDNWEDIPGETGQYYFLQPSDVGYYIRVMITATGFTGMLYSPSRLCVKDVCTQGVVTPILENSVTYNEICVTNPVSTQEYVITNAPVEPRTWKNAKTPEPGSDILRMGGTVNAMNYVFTRVKETESTLPSDDIRMAGIYFGENVYTQYLKLTMTDIGTGPGVWEIPLQESLWKHYYSYVGATIRIEAEPIPSEAVDFEGLSDCYTNSQNGSFFSDDKCTKPLESGKKYKTVYFKPTKQGNYVDVHVGYRHFYNYDDEEVFYLDVADEYNNYLVSSISMGSTVDVNKGDVISGLHVNIFPPIASIDGVTVSFFDGPTPEFPGVGFNYGNRTITVDATNASEGRYYYRFYKDGNMINGGMVVDVTATVPALEEICVLPSELELDCGQSMQLTAQLFPAGVDESITWTSSNPNVATVTSTGVVRVNDDADIGAKTIITAKAGSLTATCQVTVPGEKYNLFLAGTQVTSRNMNDLTVIEGVGPYTSSDDMAASFDGKTLYLRNVQIDGGKYGMVLGIEDMTVVVDGACWLENFRHGIMLNRSATITGNGYVCIYGTPNENSLNGIVFRENVAYPICLTLKNIELASIGNQHGVLGFDHHHSIELDNVSASVFGLEGAMINVKGGIMLNNCYTDSWNIFTDGSVTDVNGDPASGFVFFHRFKSGDVNNDNKYDISDAITLINYLSGKEVEQILLPAADANKDGQVNERDLPVVLRRISGVRKDYYK